MKLRIMDNYNKIHVVRCWSSVTSGTFGQMFVNDQFQCYTLEPPLQDMVQTKPFAIPPGQYDLRLDIVSPKFRFRSPYVKFGGKVPRLMDVPNFDGVLIHVGNFVKDSHGCILVGDSLKGFRRLYNSTRAYLDLWQKLASFKYPCKIIVEQLPNIRRLKPM